MPSLQPVRGTHDLLPEDARRHRHVIDTARAVVGRYGYQEIATPIFEFTEVFQRTLGDTSDIVTKEMYTFVDRGGEQITLRPEATAGIARAFISGGLAQHAPLKYFCAGPMFRFERPQKGRLRQFHQIDIELLGVAEPLGDVEVIAAAADVLEALGVRDKTTLELNTATPTAATPIARSSSTISRAISSACPRTAAAGSSAIRCAFSTRRTPATAPSSPTPRRSATT